MLVLLVESGAKVRIIFECAKDLEFFLHFNAIFSSFCPKKVSAMGVLTAFTWNFVYARMI